MLMNIDFVSYSDFPFFCTPPSPTASHVTRRTWILLGESPCAKYEASMGHLGGVFHTI